MKKLSEYRGKEALQIVSQLLEPISKICQNKAFVDSLKAGKVIDAVKNAIDKNADEVLEILATLEGVSVNEYNPSVMEIPVAFMSIVNDPEVLKLFTSQGVEGDATSSASALEK